MISATAKVIPYVFHPLEVAFCGFSGSGKTTLLEKLGKRWRQVGWRFAYLKHDVHGFQMDQPGKDTFRLRAAGASAVVISDPINEAMICERVGAVGCRPNFLGFDFVVVEGYKNLKLPKVAVLDPALKILEHFDDIPLTYVGPWHARPKELNTAERMTVPYIQRDNLEELLTVLESHFETHLRRTPLRGLILAGGKSRRMGRDKALISYFSGKNQLQHNFDLLTPFCEDVFISARTEQAQTKPEYSGFPVLTDTFLEMGPLGGILSALRKHPDAAWLVLAIDLPGVKEQTLQRLVTERDRFGYATAFRSHMRDVAEPLCTIYEPKSYRPILGLLGQGMQCPTRILDRLGAKLIDQVTGSDELANLNTVQDMMHFIDDKRGEYA